MYDGNEPFFTTIKPHPYDGRILEVMAFDRALTPQEWRAIVLYCKHRYHKLTLLEHAEYAWIRLRAWLARKVSQ